MSQSPEATSKDTVARRGSTRRVTGLLLTAIVTLAATSVILERLPGGLLPGQSQPAPVREYAPGDPAAPLGAEQQELYEMFMHELARQAAEPDDPGADLAGGQAGPAGRDGDPAGAAPQRLRIPAVDLDVEVTEVGDDEELSAPSPPSDAGHAGWYGAGPSPGDIGDAVLTGRTDASGTDADPGAFATLHEVDLGDEVDVEFDDDEVVTFVVDTVRVCPRRLSESVLRTAPFGTARLHLLTCGDNPEDGLIVSGVLESDDQPPESDGDRDDDADDEPGPGAEADDEQDRDDEADSADDDRADDGSGDEDAADDAGAAERTGSGGTETE